MVMKVEYNSLVSFPSFVLLLPKDEYHSYFLEHYNHILLHH